MLLTFLGLCLLCSAGCFSFRDWLSNKEVLTPAEYHNESGLVAEYLEPTTPMLMMRKQDVERTTDPIRYLPLVRDFKIMLAQREKENGTEFPAYTNAPEINDSFITDKPQLMRDRSKEVSVGMVGLIVLVVLVAVLLLILVGLYYRRRRRRLAASSLVPQYDLEELEDEDEEVIQVEEMTVDIEDDIRLLQHP